MKIIALEESFCYEKIATEGSTVSYVRVKSAVAADWQHKLLGPCGALVNDHTLGRYLDEPQYARFWGNPAGPFQHHPSA